MFCRRQGGNNHDWFRDNNGGNAKQLTGPWCEGRPVFPPDGSRIVFEPLEEDVPPSRALEGWQKLRRSEAGLRLALFPPKVRIDEDDNDTDIVVREFKSSGDRVPIQTCRTAFRSITTFWSLCLWQRRSPDILS